VTLEARLDDQGLALIGLADAGGRTIALLGPQEPQFWQRFTGAPEYGDGEPDPLDRFSKRLIGALATTLEAEAVFPSDGPPYPPFLQWARASGRCHASPVGLLVHDAAGLWLSFRGALILPQRLETPPPPPSPCIGCAQPCLSACPAGAMGAHPYDLAACHAWLDRQRARSACRQAARFGALARRGPPMAGCKRNPRFT